MTRAKPKSIYYAHAMCLYGEVEEHRQLSQIRRTFGRVSIVNPADYQDHPLKRRDTVGFCLQLVEQCDVVVFSRLYRKITAGVGKEINHALMRGKMVFELVAGRFVQRTRRVKYISRRDTINLYKKYGHSPLLQR